MIRWLALLPVLLLADTAEAAPKVTMFGASWCGPCRAVKSFLSQNRVAYEYVDIDTDSGRSRYNAARGSYRGIPLTMVGRTAIRGANLQKIRGELHRANLVAADKRPTSGAKTYGGHTPEWWQIQFRQLKDEVAQMEQRIQAQKKLTSLHDERIKLERMEEKREILVQSINQLQNDASNVSLPRKYRQ